MKISSKLSLLLLSVALIVITLAIYWRVGGHEFINYDDNLYLTENPQVAAGLTGANIIWAFTSVHASNWHPITWLSHMADVQFYGMNPRGHHLTNVVIHALSAALLLFLLFRLTSSLWQSFTVAALFALHPLHVESVAWVAERKDVLSAFFWFLTLLCYAEYVTRRKSSLYLLALSSFVLGLMAKPMLVTLPVVMLLLDFWPLNRYSARTLEPSGQRPARGYTFLALVKEKIPFFACSFLSAVVTIYAQHKGGTISTLEILPVNLRIGNAIISYAQYTLKTFWPHDLAILYPFPASLPLWQILCSLLVLILISVATIRAARNYPYLAVGWFWFLITLLPVIGLIQVGCQSMADRYTYIPIIGLFIMAAWGVPALLQGFQYRKFALALLTSAVIIISAALTWQQIGYWHDDITLFQHALSATSNNFIAHYNLGTDFVKERNLDDAIKEFQATLAIKPDYFKARDNLGAALASKGDLDAAITVYREGLALSPNNFVTHYNLGAALTSKGDLDAAIKEFQAALAINPNYVEAHYSLGITFAAKGDLDAAIKEFQAALALNPNSSKVHNNLGIALATKGELDAAIKEFQDALTLNPRNSSAYSNLEIALDQKRMQRGIRK